MTDDIDGLATKTAKLVFDEEMREWVLSPEIKLECIKTMELDSRKIAQNRSSVISPENIVKLNIGGTKFETSKSTLTKLNEMFKTMLETEVPIPKDASDCIFIDRSPKHFELILNFMRDGKIEFPSSVQEVKEIQNEAQYYQMTGLDEMCKGKIRKMTEAKALFDEEVQVIETHTQLLQVIAKVPQKPILIIYYHIGKDGRTAVPNGFDITSFMNRYRDRLNILFKSVINTNCYGSAEPSQWTWSLHSSTHYYYSATSQKGHWPTLLENDIHDFFQ